MKVLFAIGNEQTSKRVAEKYYEKFGEELEYKNVFYFKALLDEVKQNKTYDRIVISEDVEQFYVKNMESLDKFIFKNVDNITDEIEDSEIIFICSDRRTKQNDSFVEKLFNIGVYNTLILDERNVTSLCDYIRKPMNKKEAKRHLNINPVVSNGSVSTSDDTVEEVQIMNILKYYDNIKGKVDEYIPAFDRIAEQYSRNQLKIIVYYLPTDVKNKIFESEKYMFLSDGKQEENNNSSKSQKTISNKPARKGLFGILKENKNKENSRKQFRTAESTNTSFQADDFDREQAEAKANFEKQQAELKAKAEQEALEKQQAELKAKVEKEALEIQQAELRLKAEQEAIERQQAELKAKAEQEALERQQAELKAKAEQEAIERQQAELKAKAEQEALERQQAELKAKAEREVLEKQQETSKDEFDIQIEVMPSVENVVRKKENEPNVLVDNWFEKKQAELRASINNNSIEKQQAEQKAKAEKEALERQQAELKAKAEQEALERQQAELKAQAEREALAKQQAELKAKAEQEALAKQQAELKAKAEQEALERQQAELKAKAEQEALERQQAELKARAEREALAKQQAELKAKEEQEKFEAERRKLEQEKIALEEEKRRLREQSVQFNSEVPKQEYMPENRDMPKMDYKKMVVFVGANRSGTTFMVNAVSHKLASMKIGVGVLDMTRDKSLYYIYNQDDKDLRKIAMECMQKLSDGVDSYIPAERNLKIYTTIPGPGIDSRRSYKNRAIIETAKGVNNLVIVDADFSTPLEYYEKADDIYIVQDLDIMKMQETTLFLRELKNRGINMGKIKVIINKYVKSLLTPKKLIQGLSYYNDPQMSFIDELLGSKVQSFQVPFNVENYARYIDGMYNNKLDYKKYSPDFIAAIEDISSCVYKKNPVKKKRFFG